MEGSKENPIPDGGDGYRRSTGYLETGYLELSIGLNEWNQNGLVLPKDPKNLELLLRDVHQKGFLDLELLYQLKQKEEVKRVEKEIADRIENPLEEGTPLFQRVFERCLSS